MKNTDIALIILIAVVSVIASYFLGNWILGDPADLTADMIYVDEISGSLASPDIETFNNSASNPTVEVYIGNCEAGKVWDSDRRDCVDQNGGSENNNEDENTNNKEDDDDGGGDETPTPDTPEE